MAIDFATLTAADKGTEGSIRAWANHNLVPVTNILIEAEAWIYERLRVRDMIVTEEVSIAAGDGEMTLPTGFLEPLWLRFDGDAYEIDYVQENLLERQKDSDGELFEGHFAQYALINNRIEFDCAAELAIEGDFCFYKTPTSLGVSNTTNFLTLRYPMLLRTVCTGLAYDYRHRTADRDHNLKMAGGLILEANMLSDRARRGQVMR
jgi:hypothetical protein